MGGWLHSLAYMVYLQHLKQCTVTSKKSQIRSSALGRILSDGWTYMAILEGIEMLDYIFNKLLLLKWIQALRINTPVETPLETGCVISTSNSSQGDG